MFPWVYDFRWQAGHLAFLGVFFVVVLLLATHAAISLWRAVKALRRRGSEVIQWEADFRALPPSSRACRHELTGDVARRTCVHGFDCRVCDEDEVFQYTSPSIPAAVANPAREGTDVLGFRMPADRLYHRGHAWAHPEADGTVTVGLDDFASRLIGRPDQVFLPRPGERLVVNGTGWRVRKGRAEARVLSPVEGQVVEQGSETLGWALRVRPLGATLDRRHLLAGSEIRPWILREVERLQAVLSRGAAGTSLADGGLPIEDLLSAVPEARRDEVLGEVLLEP